MKGIKRATASAIAVVLLSCLASAGQASPPPHRLAVVVAQFGSTPPFTKAQVDQAIFTGPTSLVSYYDEVSRGTLHVTGGVYGYMTISSSFSGCPYVNWSSQAASWLSAQGVPPGDYDNLMVVLPKITGCGWTGLGSQPGVNSYLNGTLALSVSAHEFGHNLGLAHAGALFNCHTDQGPISYDPNAICTFNEYADPYSIMGKDNTYHFNGLERLTVGLPIDYAVADHEGVYAVAPSGMLRVPNGLGQYLDVEYRSPFGVFDPFGGVLVHLDFADARYYTRLLDGTPSTSPLADAAFATGSSVRLAPVELTVGEITPFGASITVSGSPEVPPPPPPPPPPDTQAPTAPTGVRATKLRTPARTFSITWVASSDNVAVSGYTVYRNDAQIATTTAISYTDTLAKAGTYSYTVKAFDAAGNVSASSIVVKVKA